MVNYRFKRLEEDFKREVSSIIKNEVKDPRVGFVSIVSIEISRDLRYAKIYISILGNEENVKETMTALKNASGFIRREIAHRVQLRHTPEITFIFDDSIAHGAKISKILNEIVPEEEKNE